MKSRWLRGKGTAFILIFVLVVILGFCVVLSSKLIVWAAHRSAPASLVKIPADCEPSPSNRRVEVAGFGVDMPSHLLVLDSGVPPVKIPWRFVFVNVGHPQPTVDINIQAGANVLDFAMGGGCTFRYGIIGIEVGDEFVLEGPCSTEVNTPVSYTVKLKDGTTVETPDDILSPAADITTDNGSVLTITNLTGGTNDVRIDGLIRHGILSGQTQEIGPFEFIDPGSYKLELKWFERPPPDATGTPVEVSTSTYEWDVLVRPSGGINKCQDVRIDEQWAIGQTSTVRCDGGIPVSEINEENIKTDIQNLAAQMGISLTSMQILDLTDIYKDCSEQHEGSHVAFYSDANLTPFDVCQGCGDCNVAQVFDSSDADECGVHHGGEAIGYDKSSNCFDASNVFASTDADMDTILVNLRDKHRVKSDAHLDCLLGCPYTTPPFCQNPNL